jgi:ribose transport system ATP-binding protein
VTDAPAPALQLEGIGKSYFGVSVLRDVSLALGQGRVLGLVGENGAGKSTLMNVLGGVVRPEQGSMVLDGRAYAPQAPAEASARGVAFIHQELNLFPNLSIAENLVIPRFPRARPRWARMIDRRGTRSRAAEVLAAVGLDRAPETLVGDLSPGERQLVEIGRALTIDARIIILDEPTTSLTPHESAHLFRLIGRLRGQGIAMIYISHNLGDVLALCDEIAVLRDGALVAAGPVAEFDADRLIALMVGRSLGPLFPDRTAPPGDEVVLEAEGLSQPGVIEGVSFSLHRGEVLGVAGLMGSGRTELARILFGLDPCARGDVRLNGRSLRRLPPRARVGLGMAFLTEDRREEGLMMEASIADNIALASLRSFARPATRLIDRQRTGARVAEVVQAVRLGAAEPTRAVKTLSGGNQQKVVLARWLLTGPAALLLDEPTRGVDVGAKFEIYRLIDSLAAGGAGVLVISSEIEELIGLCDRIIVLSRGTIAGTFDRARFDREAILRAALREEGGEA